MELIGPNVRLDHAYGITMRPGTSGLGLHGPAEPFDSSQYYLHRMGVMRSGLLTLSWSLSGGGPGDGGFGCIPGSHRTSEPLPLGAESLVVEVPQPAGSLLVFTEALMHCTIPWQGADTRWAVLYKYSPGSTAWGSSPAVPRRWSRRCRSDNSDSSNDRRSAGSSRQSPADATTVTTHRRPIPRPTRVRVTASVGGNAP